MSEKTFYDFKGEPIDVKKFIELYEPCYFIENKKAKGIRHTQTARCVEEEIVAILNGHIENEHIKFRANLAKVMAWKIGKIKHEEIKKNEMIVYASDWKLCETKNPKRYGEEMDLDTLAKSMFDNRNELKKLAAEKPQECLNQLRDVAEKIDGMGPVYLINLLFFLSHGKCPIYDRFAMASLRAYEEGLSPVGHKGKPPVKVPNLPDKNSKRFTTICEDGIYAKYIEKIDVLNNALGINDETDRRLDRALWVYGHAFEVKEGKCC